jgi:hypothetical protein
MFLQVTHAIRTVFAGFVEALYQIQVRRARFTLICVRSDGLQFSAVPAVFIVI